MITVNFDCIFLFPLFRLASGNLIHLGYIRFSQNWSGPWLRGDSDLGLWYNKLHSNICIVLLSEFVFQNEWLQHDYIALCSKNLSPPPAGRTQGREGAAGFALSWPMS